DGSMLMVCRGGGVWVSRDGLAPYRQVTHRRVYPAVKGEFEDPVVWRDSLQYHLIVNDWLGRIAFYERSLDGVHWVVEPGEAYVPGVSVHADGEVEHWFKYERPKVLQDAQGRAEQMNFAVIDTLKDQDLPRDRHSSKNIAIPLKREMLTEVLSADRREVTVRLRAEEGFVPAEEVDAKSLRWGSYTDVNYGRGAKVKRSRAEGGDLVVTFDVRNYRLPADDFAPKMLGAKRSGDWVFAHTLMPGTDLEPAIVSPACPQVKDGRMTVVVENFGLSASRPQTLRFTRGDQTVSISVPALQPYEQVTLSAPCGEGQGRWDYVAEESTPAPSNEKGRN
ncbi:MAG: hypothetical protein HUK02_10545, partial [Bacteroidaceae bacterium]|nr:hypothetical protein [Bacteroidaceae bacterium]